MGVKNGTMNTWLRDAYQHNAKFLEKTKVIKVVTKKGVATGVECLVNYERKVTIKADQVVVSAGSLQSPGVLMRSGLKNKNIGRNLRLHPCSITFGFFDRPIRTFEGSIVTAVSGVVEIDGYGAKLEVPQLHPGSFSTVVPWHGAAAHKEIMLKYDQCLPS
jgi:glycerol-3-phosphate dehydrogenase